MMQTFYEFDHTPDLEDPEFDVGHQCVDAIRARDWEEAVRKSSAADMAHCEPGVEKECILYDGDIVRNFGVTAVLTFVVTPK